VNSVRIESIETDNRAGRIDHHIEPDVVRLGELVGRLLEVVVDLFDTARKSRSIMSFESNGLNDVGGRL
jgi:hypothetical protein